MNTVAKRNVSGSCVSLSSPRRPGSGPATPRKTSSRDKHQSDLADIQSDQESGGVSDAETEKVGGSTETVTLVKRRVTSAGTGARQPVR